MADHVCPVWLGYLHVWALRKLLQDPDRILSPRVSKGMRVLDVGCGMGFFSLPMASLVGSEGRVICVDLQPPMLDALRRRAKKAGVSDRVETRRCEPASLNIEDLAGRLDFALAFFVAHEVPDQATFFTGLRGALKCGARLLLAEPRSRVFIDAFQKTIGIAKREGFVAVEAPAIRWSHAVILEKS